MLTAVSALPLQKEKTDKRKRGMASMPLSGYFKKNQAASDNPADVPVQKAPATTARLPVQPPPKPTRPKRKMTLGQRIAQKD
jgi:hypothetical protein